MCPPHGCYERLVVVMGDCEAGDQFRRHQIIDLKTRVVKDTWRRTSEGHHISISKSPGYGIPTGISWAESSSTYPLENSRCYRPRRTVMISTDRKARYLLEEILLRARLAHECGRILLTYIYPRGTLLAGLTCTLRVQLEMSP